MMHLLLKGGLMMSYKKICIAGQIGIGKSTLGVALAKQKRGVYLAEALDGEILNAFYTAKKTGNNFKKIELLSQYSFLTETIKREIKDSIIHKERITIFDRQVGEHVHVFAKQNLSREQYYKYLGHLHSQLDDFGFEKYDMTILLRCDMEQILQRIAIRGRDVEQDIPKKYLEALQDIYNSDDFIQDLLLYSKEVKVLDNTNMDAAETLVAVVELLETYII